jgi:hypothetical protein
MAWNSEDLSGVGMKTWVAAGNNRYERSSDWRVSSGSERGFGTRNSNRSPIKTLIIGEAINKVKSRQQRKRKNRRE